MLYINFENLNFVGTDVILTYYAKQAAKWIAEEGGQLNLNKK
jgi:delta-aminolevulinic acid dehydratase/porphobilinogen synthase